MSPQKDPFIGKRLGTCEILGRLGSGGMAIAYRANHCDHGEICVKVINPDHRQNIGLLQRFRREAMALQLIKHPHVVRGYGMEEAEGQYLLLQELVPGGDLEHYLKARGKTSHIEVLSLAHEIALGLAAAHERRLVHRDLKPANVLIGAYGHAKVGDFGLVLHQDDDSPPMTCQGQFFGSPAYMAPEQWRSSHDVDHRVDLYSLGVLIHYLLTGRYPIQAGSVLEFMTAHLRADPAPLRSHLPGAPAELERLLLLLVSKDRDDRPKSAEEVAFSLQRITLDWEATAPERTASEVLDRTALPRRAAVDLLTGDVIRDKYRVLAEIGRGGMGIVYRAHNLMIRRDCALKVIRSDLAQDPEFRQRFIAEASAMMSFNHDGLVTLRDCDEHDGRLYLVLDYVPGKNVAQVLREEGTFSEPRVLEIARQVLTCLARAHEVGLVHRDVKPENLLLEQVPAGRERVRLCDFGIAALLDDARRPGGLDHRMGVVIGTLDYMSPEQVAGDPIDPRADLYSFGCVLYQLLSGRLPFESRSPAERLARLMREVPPPLDAVAPSGVSAHVARAVMQALAARRADRPPTALSFLSALVGRAPSYAAPDADHGEGAGRPFESPSASRDASERFLAQVERESAFSPDVYVERRESRCHVEAFLSGPTPALILLGASGMGKTWFISSLVRSAMEAGRLVVPLFASTLPSSAAGIEAALSASLSLAPPLKDAVRQVERASDSQDHRPVLIVLDGIDRHVDPAEAMRGVIRVAQAFQGTRSFRMLLSCTVAAIEGLRRRGLPFDPLLFYQSARGLSDSAAGEPLPGVLLGPMTEEEFAEGYQRYQRHPGTAPTTPFEQLSDEARRALANPLLLKIAMSLYHGQPMPAHILSGEILGRYLDRRVFSDPDRRRFIGVLIDQMSTRGLPALWKQDLLEHAALTSAPYIRPEALLEALVEEHILSVLTKAPPEGVPLPGEDFVEVTSERIRDYLILWRLVWQGRTSRTRLDEVLDQARRYPPLRGALTLFYSCQARAGSLLPLEDLLSRLEDESAAALAHDVFLELFESDDQGGGTSGAEVAASLARSRPAEAEALLSRVGEALFMRGRWQAAQGAIMTLIDLDTDASAVVRQRNRLVCLCKNMDRWPLALEHSNDCLIQLGPDAAPELVSRVHVNRGSVLYDLGRREEAASAFQLALDRAPGTVARREMIAATNNLGIFHLYHDELDNAEDKLRKGLVAADANPIATAYLETNLGLVAITRALTDRAWLPEAEAIFDRALERFRRAAHLQGISYSLSNRGICHLTAGRIEEAGRCFHETIQLAEKIGERWSAYGARANLALLHLMGPTPSPLRAWELVSEVIADAQKNSDPKGIADAALIAGRAALEIRAGAGPAAAPVDAAHTLLAEAAYRFERLGQRLGAAQAYFGLMDLLGDGNVFEMRGRNLLAKTPLHGLPSRLIALPWQMMLLMEIF